MQARRSVRMVLWVLWGAVLVAAPAGTYYLKFCTRLSSTGVSGGMSPLDFAWSSSLPLSVLAWNLMENAGWVSADGIQEFGWQLLIAGGLSLSISAADWIIGEVSG